MIEEVLSWLETNSFIAEWIITILWFVLLAVIALVTKKASSN